MKTFSIITPVYNGQEYIAKCIETIAQCDYDLTKIEHIIVDDGSTDNTKSICEEYAKKYNHIKFYSKTNGNWGSVINYVKNNKLVNNEYITICDADDCILSKSFSYVDKNSNNTDIFCGSYWIKHRKKNKNKIYTYMFFFKKEFSIVQPKYFVSRYLVPNCVFFKKELFYQIDPLSENVMYQDGVLFNELFLHSKKFRFTWKCLSEYWQGRDGNSMSQSNSAKGWISWKKRIEYIQGHDLIEEATIQLIFNKNIRKIVKKESINFVFTRKPKFCAYPWWIRIFVVLLYRVVAKKYIKIVRK